MESVRQSILRRPERKSGVHQIFQTSVEVEEQKEQERVYRLRQKRQETESRLLESLHKKGHHVEDAQHLKKLQTQMEAERARSKEQRLAEEQAALKHWATIDNDLEKKDIQRAMDRRKKCNEILRANQQTVQQKKETERERKEAENQRERERLAAEAFESRFGTSLV